MPCLSEVRLSSYLKTRLNEMANQIQYIVGKMKPLSWKKAEEVALTSSESETEDLEPLPLV